jgi:acyl-CoA dehydrogenase
LHAAWKIDKEGAQGARVEISAIKFMVAGTLQRVLDRAIQVLGALGMTDQTPLAWWYRHERGARIYDGPDEVHKVTVARQVLKNYKAHDVPSVHVPTRQRLAREKFAEYLDAMTAND